MGKIAEEGEDAIISIVNLTCGGESELETSHQVRVLQGVVASCLARHCESRNR